MGVPLLMSFTRVSVMGGLHQDCLPFLETASRKDVQCERAEAYPLVSTQDSCEGPPAPELPKEETEQVYLVQSLSMSMAAVVLEGLLSSHSH